jgi:hypothetical protein
MAKVLWNRLSSRFLYRVFLEVKMDDGDKDIKSLLVQALEGLGCGEGHSHLNLDFLKKNLRQTVRSHAVLYILDNVRTSEQLEALLPASWHEGSAVVITSREMGFRVGDRDLKKWVRT